MTKPGPYAMATVGVIVGAGLLIEAGWVLRYVRGGGAVAAGVLLGVYGAWMVLISAFIGGQAVERDDQP